MPKTSSTDCINVAFEEIGETLNNPKLREGFLNGNKENEIINKLVDMFAKQEMNKKEHNLIVEKSHKSNVDHTSKTNKILHVPARVSHNSVLVTDTDRRPRVIENNLVPVTETDGRSTVNPKKISHVPNRGESKCEQKPVEMTILSPFSHFPKEIII